MQIVRTSETDKKDECLYRFFFMTRGIDRSRDVNKMCVRAFSKSIKMIK